MKFGENPPHRFCRYISFGVVSPSTLFVRPEPYLSTILGINDQYHGLSVSYKFRQNRPLNTGVIALVFL